MILLCFVIPALCCVISGTLVIHCELVLRGGVLLLMIAPAEVKVPPNTQPRFLQDEGFYVGSRPYVSPPNLNRMENRLLKEAGGGYVTRDEEACIDTSEIEPVSRQWNCYLFRHVRKTRICDCRIFGTLPHFLHILAKCAYRIFFRIFWHFRRQ